MVKIKLVKGKKVAVAGVTHAATEDDKNLSEFIREADVVGIEGINGLCYGCEENFVGELGKKLLSKLSKPVARIDIVKGSCYREKEKYFLFRNEKESKILKSLVEKMLCCGFLPLFVYEEIVYNDGSDEAYTKGKIYRKLVDAFGSTTAFLRYPLYSIKDVGMARAISTLTEEYDNVLAVVGKYHLYPVSRFLDNQEKLERQFRRFSRCFQDELEVRAPVKKMEYIRYGEKIVCGILHSYPVVCRIPLKKRNLVF